MIIDVGSPCENLPNGLNLENTILALTNPANASGIIDTIKIWLTNADGVNVKVGFFYGSGFSWTYRCSATFGAVVKNAERTLNELSLEIEEGDIIGITDATPGTSAIEISNNDAGGSGILFLAGNHMVAEGAKTYAAIGTNRYISCYATGNTPSTLKCSVPRIAKLMMVNG